MKAIYGSLFLHLSFLLVHIIVDSRQRGQRSVSCASRMPSLMNTRLNLALDQLD